MKVPFNQEQDATDLRTMEAPELSTLAEYMFVDYFVMIAKSGIQEAINNYKQIPLLIEDGESLKDLVHRYKDRGVVLETLAFANRHQPLCHGAKLMVPEFRYRLRSEETVEQLIERMPELPKEKLLIENTIPEHANANIWVTVPSFTYEIPDDNTHSFWSLSERFNIDFNTLLANNQSTKNLFAIGTKLLHAFTQGEGLNR